MTVYVIAQLKFKDRPRYDRYQSRFMDVFHQFDGRLLAADEHPVVLEGGRLRQGCRDVVPERDIGARFSGFAGLSGDR